MAHQGRKDLRIFTYIHATCLREYVTLTLNEHFVVHLMAAFYTV